MSKKLANFLFLLATIGWGSSYLFTKYAVAEMHVFTLVALRFAIAFTVAFCVFYKRMIKVSKRTLGYSAVLGLLMCSMTSVLNIVLKTVNPATAGFLLSTMVVIVPLFMMIVTRKLPQKQVIIGTVVIFIGLCLFMLQGGMAVDKGALICIASACLFSIHLIVNNFFAQSNDALQLGVFQLGFASVFGILLMLLFEPIQGPQSSLGWISVCMLAVVSSAFGFVVQSVAQNYTTAEETSFILALEPIFAAGFAYIALGDTLTGREWLGAFIIFIGVLFASYSSKKELQQVQKDISIS